MSASGCGGGVGVSGDERELNRVLRSCFRLINDLWSFTSTRWRGGRPRGVTRLHTGARRGFLVSYPHEDCILCVIVIYIYIGMYTHTYIYIYRVYYIQTVYAQIYDYYARTRVGKHSFSGPFVTSEKSPCTYRYVLLYLRVHRLTYIYIYIYMTRLQIIFPVRQGDVGVVAWDIILFWGLSRGKCFRVFRISLAAVEKQ